ncbi:hypothetical protein ACLI4U_08825 [Natrialbaceae archaeon A-CW2]
MTGSVQWRRDASTSRLVRVLWALGVGTFFAVLSIIVFWRLFDLTGEVGGQVVIVGIGAALVVTILLVALSRNTEGHVARVTQSLSLEEPTARGVRRAVDAALGTIAMIGIIGGLMVVGRYVSQEGLLEVGAGPFTFLAALSIPLALVALVLSSFLRSVGTIDAEEGALYLHDPDEHVALEHLEGVSVRQFGQTAVVTLEYATRDGTYVPGPRRLVVPADVARELEGLIDTTQ